MSKWHILAPIEGFRPLDSQVVKILIARFDPYSGDNRYWFDLGYRAGAYWNRLCQEPGASTSVSVPLVEKEEVVAWQRIEPPPPVEADVLIDRVKEVLG